MVSAEVTMVIVGVVVVVVVAVAAAAAAECAQNRQEERCLHFCGHLWCYPGHLPFVS